MTIRTQVEKNGNWFSGNYVPDKFLMAISSNENQTCEYAGGALNPKPQTLNPKP